MAIAIERRRLSGLKANQDKPCLDVHIQCVGNKIAIQLV